MMRDIGMNRLHLTRRSNNSGPLLIHWETAPPDASGVTVEEIDWFYTRNMRRLFGTIHHLGACAFSLELWRTRQWQFFVRFLNTCPGSPGRSFQLFGFAPREEPHETRRGDNEQLVPKEIRDLFEEYLCEG